MSASDATWSMEADFSIGAIVQRRFELLFHRWNLLWFGIDLHREMDSIDNLVTFYTIEYSAWKVARIKGDREVIQKRSFGGIIYLMRKVAIILEIKKDKEVFQQKLAMQ